MIITSRSRRTKVLVTHMGLGDAVLQLGLAVVLSKSGPVAFPAYPQYMASVRSFFARHPDIRVYPVPNKPGFDWGSPPYSAYETAIREAGLDDGERVKLGVYTGKGLWCDFSKNFYHDAGIDYEQRFDSCPVLEAASLVPQLEWQDPKGRKIFVHDDPSRGFNITRIKGDVYRPAVSPYESILRYVTMLRTASVVAVIDSSFLHLANCLALTGDAQVHAYARWPRPQGFRYVSRNVWEYLF